MPDQGGLPSLSAVLPTSWRPPLRRGVLQIAVDVRSFLAAMCQPGFVLQALGLFALLDGFPGAVPNDAGVVAVGVQLQHRFDDVLDGLFGVDDVGEVA
jgi:hypothetical protein